MIVTMFVPAAPGDSYAPGAFDAQVGRTLPVHVEGQASGTGRVVGARVAEDGTGVHIDLDVPAHVGAAMAHRGNVD